MGLLDHNRTWHFELNATPDSCAAAFVAALHGKSAISVRKAHWRVTQRRSGDGLPTVVGTYKGRGGLAKGITMLSQRATDVEQRATGSQITFEVKQHDPSTHRTVCVMWLSTAGTMLGFTADAGFFRSYMNDVARAFAQLDPDVAVEKA